MSNCFWSLIITVRVTICRLVLACFNKGKEIVVYSIDVKLFCVHLSFIWFTWFWWGRENGRERFCGICRKLCFTVWQIFPKFSHWSVSLLKCSGRNVTDFSVSSNSFQNLTNQVLIKEDCQAQSIWPKRCHTEHDLDLSQRTLMILLSILRRIGFNRVQSSIFVSLLWEDISLLAWFSSAGKMKFISLQVVVIKWTDKSHDVLKYVFIVHRGVR